MSRRKKSSFTVTSADFESAVMEIFGDMGQSVSIALNESLEETAKEAVDALHGVNSFAPNGHPTGKYSADWTYKIEPLGRLASKMIVYNEGHAGLAHLLENGHVVKNGGRVTGTAPSYEHIRPINDAAQDRVIREIIKKVEIEL